VRDARAQTPDQPGYARPRPVSTHSPCSAAHRALPERRHAVQPQDRHIASSPAQTVPGLPRRFPCHSAQETTTPVSGPLAGTVARVVLSSELGERIAGDPESTSVMSRAAWASGGRSCHADPAAGGDPCRDMIGCSAHQSVGLAGRGVPDPQYAAVAGSGEPAAVGGDRHRTHPTAVADECSTLAPEPLLGPPGQNHLTLRALLLHGPSTVRVRGDSENAQRFGAALSHPRGIMFAPIRPGQSWPGGRGYRRLPESRAR